MNNHNSNILTRPNKAVESRSKSKNKQRNQLTERVYEQMLGNYYQTKYSKLMAKITKEQFKLNYQSDFSNNQNNSLFQPYSQRKGYMSNYPNNKKRKNFKQLIRKRQKQVLLSKQKSDKQSQGQPQNNNHNKNKLNFYPHRCQEKNSLSKNQKSPRSSTSPRKNFKQSMREKSKQNQQNRQNMEIYKKLESSIIKQLYSPSPKKIQSGKYAYIQLRNSNSQKKSVKNEDSLFPQNSNQSVMSNRSNKNSVKSSEFHFENNIQIVQYRQQEDQTSEQNLENELQNVDDETERINPFNRQTIKNLKKRRQIMQRYSPMKGSRKSQKSSKSSQNKMQQRASWNPNFMNSSTFNKSLSNSSNNDSRLSSPRKQDQQKNINIKTTSSQIKNSKNMILSGENQNIAKKNETENQNQQQNMNIKNYNKPEIYFQNEEDMIQDDGDIQFILPINDGLNQSQRRNQSYDRQYNFEDNLTQRQRWALEMQQNNSKQSKQQNNRKSSDANISDRKQSFNRSQNNHSSKNHSLNNSIHQISMISRFSMTQDQGALIKQKLQDQIINNQFGPYQNALADLRDLINQFPTAWPIYVVGQRTLDDREQYQSKREFQKKIMTDYLNKIQNIKEKNMKSKNQSQQEYKIRQNKLKIMQLTRSLAKKTVEMN